VIIVSQKRRNLHLICQVQSAESTGNLTASGP